MGGIGVAALAATVGLLLATGSAAAERPNIVILMADDLGYGDPGCYNADSKIPTPHMDRLARGGMRFTDAHTPSAVCTPTRYGLLTGRYAWRSRLKRGVLYGYSRSLIEPGRMTIGSLLQDHGYATAAVGKWHLGFQEHRSDAGKVDYSEPLRPGPVTVGFDSFFGIPASLDMPPYVYVRDDAPVEQPTEQIDRSERVWSGGGGFWRGGAIAPGFEHIDVLPRTAKEAAGVIERHGEGTDAEPFFLYFALSAPHTPWLPTKAYEGKSEAGPYGDFVAQVDAALGRVMAALKKTGEAENTLVVFTSDNGSHWPPRKIEEYGHEANNGLRGQKADIWEGGHRVPFIARWPGRVEAGSVSDQTICLTDLLATSAAIVDAELPADAGEDSYNILPALRGEADGPLREATVHHSLRGTFAIRQGPWKLIEGRGSGGFTDPRHIPPKKLGPDEPKGQLYHLADDPKERNNLYNEKPQVVERLGKLLDTYRSAGRSAPR